MLYRAYMLSGIIMLSCITGAFSMKPTQSIFALARQYLQAQPAQVGSEVLPKGEVVLKELAAKDGRSVKIVKKSMGNQIVCCTSVDDNPVAFAWSIKSDETQNRWTGVVFNTFDVASIVEEHDISKDLSKDESDPYLFLIDWMFRSGTTDELCLLSISLKHEEGCSPLPFNKNDYALITAEDIFILNVACALALKNANFDMIEKFLTYQQDLKYCRNTLMQLIQCGSSFSHRRFAGIEPQYFNIRISKKRASLICQNILANLWQDLNEHYKDDKSATFFEAFKDLEEFKKNVMKNIFSDADFYDSE